VLLALVGSQRLSGRNSSDVPAPLCFFFRLKGSNLGAYRARPPGRHELWSIVAGISFNPANWINLRFVLFLASIAVEKVH
jgi:hypothetical protein